MPPELINLLSQIPLVVLFYVIIERRDKQWQATLTKMSAQAATAMQAMTTSINELTKQIACQVTAEAIVEKLSAELRSRKDGSIK